jgi:Undecaprenyl-phosphate glucose phosphotransferase
MRQAKVEMNRPAPAQAGSAPHRRTRSRQARQWPPSAIRALAPGGFAYLAALVDAIAIVGAAYVAKFLYDAVTHGLPNEIEMEPPAGVVVALLVVLSTAQRGDYDLARYTSRSGQVSRAFPVWNIAFLVVLALGFATKTTSEFSRGAGGVFYVAGFASIALARRALVDLAHAMRRTRLTSARRMVVVGFEDRLAEALRSEDPDRDGVEIVGVIALRDDRAFIADDLSLAAAAVRMHRADDVLIAIPWSRGDLLEACAAAFLLTPVQIHLAADGVLERFGEAKVARLGGMVGLRITRAPLTRLQRLEKRAFDLAVASAALVALAPMLFIVALVIRLDSPGPVLFRQKRYGFNQEPFRIYKFRSMTTLDDGASVAQATRADPRVTGIGGYLRRFSIDELPQLLNVLRGEMSIVGPRPHALAHDQRYVERLAQYARRHNVKPGITGWAQVWGHRGEIADDQAMQARLEHDLHYVDHWSLWLDVKIALMTIFSPRAHRNAY